MTIPIMPLSSFSSCRLILTPPKTTARRRVKIVSISNGAGLNMIMQVLMVTMHFYLTKQNVVRQLKENRYRIHAKQ